MFFLSMFFIFFVEKLFFFKRYRNRFSIIPNGERKKLMFMSIIQKYLKNFHELLD